MIVIILGAPGSGKGTQCKWISKEYNIQHISMGDIFRKSINEKNQIGLEVEQYINEGKLVPDKIAVHTLENVLDDISDLSKGIILDGYPRTIVQAQKLDEYLTKKGLQVDKVINLTIPDEEIISRVINRRICSNPECGEIYNLKNNPPKIEGECDKCGGELIKRKDDTKETALNRVNIYHEQTEPLINYYKSKNKLNTVVGMGSVEDTIINIRKAIAK